MPKLRVIKNNFTAGELTPYLAGRPDFPAYESGVELLDNFTVMPHGGIIRRSGFRYVDFVKPNVEPLYRVWKLIPFVYSEEDAFVIEVGHLYARFYKNKARINFELALPYTYEDLKDLSYTQSANVMYLFHEKYQTRRLIRVADNDWQTSLVDFYDGPYHGSQIANSNTLAKETWTLVPSAIGPIGTSVQIDIQSGGSSILPLTTADIGRYVRIAQYVLRDEDTISYWGVAKITALNSVAPRITATVIREFADLTESLDWRMSAFQGPDHWPKFGVMHEGRLVIAGTKAYPNTVFGSVIDDLTNFTPTTQDGEINDDNAYNYTLGSNQIDKINWISSGKGLMVGTLGGPYSMTGGEMRVPIGPLAIKATKETSYGCKRMGVAFSDRSHVYASQTGKALHELYYSYNDDAFISPSVSIRAEHLLRDGVEEITLAQDPYPVLWARTSQNDLLSMCYLRDQQIVAWGRNSGVVVKALAVIPTNDYDQLWIVTIRNGVETMEVLEDIYTGEEGKNNGFFLDSAMSFAIQGVTTHQLPHLVNTPIVALIDGYRYETTTNGIGNFTVPIGSYRVIAGLPYTSKVKLLPPEVFSTQGSTVGLLKIIQKVWLDVYETLGGTAGGETLEYRTTEDFMDQSENLFTGEIDVPYPGRRSHYPAVDIETNAPFPMHLRKVIQEVSIGDP